MFAWFRAAMEKEAATVRDVALALRLYVVQALSCDSVSVEYDKWVFIETYPSRFKQQMRPAFIRAIGRLYPDGMTPAGNAAYEVAGYGTFVSPGDAAIAQYEQKERAEQLRLKKAVEKEWKVLNKLRKEAKAELARLQKAEEKEAKAELAQQLKLQKAEKMTAVTAAAVIAKMIRSLEVAEQKVLQSARVVAQVVERLCRRAEKAEKAAAAAAAMEERHVAAAFVAGTPCENCGLGMNRYFGSGRFCGQTCASRFSSTPASSKKHHRFELEHREIFRVHLPPHRQVVAQVVQQQHGTICCFSVHLLS